MLSVTIPDFPNYTINEYGEVRNAAGKVLTPSVQPSGYLKIYLYKDNVRYMRYLHRLVAECFLPNSYNLPEVNHIDKDKSNCKVSNLEWCDRQHNMAHGKGRAVSCILNGVTVATYKTISEAATAMHDKSHGANILRCINGLRPTAYGYAWKYADNL